MTNCDEGSAVETQMTNAWSTLAGSLLVEVYIEKIRNLQWTKDVTDNASDCILEVYFAK